MGKEMTITAIEWKSLVTCGLQSGRPAGKEDSVEHYSFLFFSLSLPAFGLFYKTGLQGCKDKERESNVPLKKIHFKIIKAHRLQFSCTQVILGLRKI